MEKNSATLTLDGCFLPLREEYMALVAEELELLLKQPHRVVCKDRLLGQAAQAVPYKASVIGTPAVRLQDRRGVLYLMVSDPCHTDFEVPAASGFLLSRGAELYFQTPNNDYLISVE